MNLFILKVAGLISQKIRWHLFPDPRTNLPEAFCQIIYQRDKSKQKPRNSLSLSSTVLEAFKLKQISQISQFDTSYRTKCQSQCNGRPLALSFLWTSLTWSVTKRKVRYIFDRMIIIQDRSNLLTGQPEFAGCKLQSGNLKAQVR